jgi:hypothetical protein
MKEEWLFPNAIVPVDVETTAALVAEIHRLIGVVGGMALAQSELDPVHEYRKGFIAGQIDMRDRPEEQPQQEPVAFYVYKPTLPRGHLGNVSDGDLPWVYDQDPSSGYSARMLVYTSPPQRTWVGLTDEDMADITSLPIGTCSMMLKVEAKLKEKNT